MEVVIKHSTGLLVNEETTTEPTVSLTPPSGRRDLWEVSLVDRSPSTRSRGHT